MPLTTTAGRIDSTCQNFAIEAATIVPPLFSQSKVRLLKSSRVKKLTKGQNFVCMCVCTKDKKSDVVVVVGVEWLLMWASMKMKMVKYLVSALPIHAALFPESSDRRTHMYLLCVSTARIYICNSFNKKRSNAKSKKRNNLSIGMAMFISDISLLFSKESPQEF